MSSILFTILAASSLVSALPSFPGPGFSPAHASYHYVSQFRGGIHPRQADVDTGAGRCGPGSPCLDGSCCGSNGKCGYMEENCKNGCQSNCDATAMCGKYSESGKQSCGMDICCSASGWCGTESLHCINAPSWGPGNAGDCQKGFGKCEIIKAPTCGGNSASNGRRIAYYQWDNIENRKCAVARPRDLKTQGFTHLYYAFASVSPQDFTIVDDEAGQGDLYREFTGLKAKGVQPWIAIGGFDFSDADKPTHTTWSKMAGSAGSRAAFINSVKAFCAKYSFTGVDLDWEYPVDPERGGQREDRANFVSLVREMRASFGSSLGISVTLAPDYWYLQYFDAKGMSDSVDWFGFMAYDLHGPWASDEKSAIVKGHTDMREIEKDILPLFYDGLDPAKINFGMAYYGRGFKLADPNCKSEDCKFSGPSAKQECTDSEGIASIGEIQAIIKRTGIQPTLMGDAKMKQLSWDGNWIGYDDDETMKMKLAFADSHCFGGSMYWSIDFLADLTATAPPLPPASSSAPPPEKTHAGPPPHRPPPHDGPPAESCLAMLVLWAIFSQDGAGLISSFQDQDMVYVLQGDDSHKNGWAIKCHTDHCEHDTDCGGCAPGYSARYGFTPGSLYNSLPLPADVKIPGMGHLTWTLDFLSQDVLSKRAIQGALGGSDDNWNNLVKKLAAYLFDEQSTLEGIISGLLGAGTNTQVYGWAFTSCPDRPFENVINP